MALLIYLWDMFYQGLNLYIQGASIFEGVFQNLF